MTKTNDLGTVLRDGDRIGLRYARDLMHPPEKVWRALTESEHMAAWMACDMVGERRTGAPIELRLWPAIVETAGSDFAVLPGVIRVWDRPNVFEWTWDNDVLRWELSEIDDGTRLIFTTWFAEQDTPLSDVGAGYHVWLDALADHLDTGNGTPVAYRDLGPVESRYATIAQL